MSLAFDRFAIAIDNDLLTHFHPGQAPTRPTIRINDVSIRADGDHQLDCRTNLSRVTDYCRQTRITTQLDIVQFGLGSTRIEQSKHQQQDHGHGREIRQSYHSRDNNQADRTQVQDNNRCLERRSCSYQISGDQKHGQPVGTTHIIRCSHGWQFTIGIARTPCRARWHRRPSKSAAQARRRHRGRPRRHRARNRLDSLVSSGWAHWGPRLCADIHRHADDALVRGSGCRGFFALCAQLCNEHVAVVGNRSFCKPACDARGYRQLARMAPRVFTSRHRLHSRITLFSRTRRGLSRRSLKICAN